jgi:hypothetical protein
MPNNYVLLDRIELNASAASVTFDNIPQTGYTDLKLVMSARSSDVSNIAFEMSVTFNGNTTGYTARQIFGDGSSAGSSTPTIRPAGFIVGTSATANTFSNGEMYIPNYRGSQNKSYSVDSVTETNGTTQYMNLVAGLWSNTAAITSILIAGTSGSFAANSTFSLYGLAQVGTTPAIAPKADGGNVITTDGTYWYHAFLSNGTFTPQVALSADILVVAGGGGGGGSIGGGGGAGGILAFTGQSLTTTGYTCTVGGGGAGGSFTGGTNGTNGVNSSFSALTASVGGGGGGTYIVATGAGSDGLSGGSGGGGSAANTTLKVGGAATSGQGFAGGSGKNGINPYFGGGGGGAGAVGADASTTAGNGGAGLNTWSTWATATGTGVSGYYGGGGGGTAYNTGTAGTGGSGGGGVGASSGATTAGSGTVNTGGGGGGGWFNSGAAGAGGSGIVIIRYLVA